MKIISWNVNGIRACVKKGFLNFLTSHQPDVMCIQETKAHKEQLTEDVITPKGYQSYWSSAERKGYSGTLTYIKEGLNLEEVKYGIGIKKFDSEGRFVITQVQGMTIYNIYFPNGSSGDVRHQYKMDFLKKFLSHIKKEQKKNKNLIILGDFNVAPEDIDVFDPVGLKNVSGFLPEEKEWFKKFSKEGFLDTFRFKNPKKQVFSWWSYREMARISNRGWRIDHICVSESLKKKVEKAELWCDISGSDHCPAVLYIGGK